MSKDIFSNNPTLDLYYKTSDGNAFLLKMRHITTPEL